MQEVDGVYCVAHCYGESSTQEHITKRTHIYTYIQIYKGTSYGRDILEDKSVKVIRLRVLQRNETHSHDILLCHYYYMEFVGPG